MMRVPPCRAMLLAGAMLAASTPGIVNAQQVGIAAAIKGDVRIAQTERGKKRKIARKQGVSLGNLIATKGKSELDILLRDKSTFSIPEDTDMVIDRYVYDPGKERSVFARVLYGAVRFFSGEPTPKSRADIKTPSAELGILGTAVDTIVGNSARKIAEDEPAIPGNTDHDKKTATLVVLRGPGANTEGGLAVGRVDVTGAGVTVTLDEPGLAAYVPRAGAAPIGPFRISGSGLSDVMERQQPSVANAGGGPGLGGILAGLAVIGATAVILGGGDNTVGGTAGNNSGDTAGNGNNDPQCGVTTNC